MRMPSAQVCATTLAVHSELHTTPEPHSDVPGRRELSAFNVVTLSVLGGIATSHSPLEPPLPSRKAPKVTQMAQMAASATQRVTKAVTEASPLGSKGLAR